jgi:hypothetical protein
VESRAADGTCAEKPVMIAPPKTYAQWTDLFKTFSAGMADEDVLHAMRTGTIAWQSGVAERFAQRFIDTLNTRMKCASDVFDRDMQRASDERTMISALLALRRSLAFLRTVADLPAVPAEQRAQFVALVQHAADRMQESLISSAKNDRTGKMSALVRNHKVNALETEEHL